MCFMCWLDIHIHGQTTGVRHSELLTNNHLVRNTVKPFRHEEAHSRSGGGAAHSTEKHVDCSPSPHQNKPWDFFFIGEKKQGCFLLNEENGTWLIWKNAALHEHAVLWSPSCTEQRQQSRIQSMQVSDQRRVLSLALYLLSFLVLIVWFIFMFLRHFLTSTFSSGDTEKALKLSLMMAHPQCSDHIWNDLGTVYLLLINTQK